VPAVAVAKEEVLAAPKPDTGPDRLIGRTIARCRIESKIGEGRTSRVYRAIHTALDAPVAVKVLLPHVLQHPAIVVKFEQEARALAKLDHPNVVKIYDVVAEEGDIHAIVMELLEGETVLEMLDREGRVDPLDAMRIVRQAASGLAAAHGKSLIHRDVKPQNLVLLPDGTVKVVDFGLAAETGGEMAAERIGTPHYMSPEVCESRPAEPASDVYSLGITLYHLLVGQPPYAGMSIKEILEAHAAGKPLHPERRLPGLPKKVCDLVRSMTKRDPLVRPEAAQVIVALDEVGGKALSALPTLRGKKKHHRPAASRKRSGAPLAIVGIVAVIVIGVGVAMIANRSGDEPSGGTQTGQTPAAPGATPPAAPPPPPPPPPAPAFAPAPREEAPAEPLPGTPEYEARKKAQEDLARKEQGVEAERRKEQAKTALADATEFARNNSDDKGRVARKYREVAAAFKGTEAGTEALRRAEGVEKGEIHPHPDRSFASKSAVDAARETLEANLPKIEEAIVARRYDDIATLVPDVVDDPTGKVTEELRFWRGLGKNLTAFTKGLKKEVATLPPAQRVVRTAKGVLPVRLASDTGLQVERDSDLVDLRWVDLEPAALADLATAAFAEKDYAEPLAAYAFAHRLENLYWQAVLSLDDVARERSALMEARAETRFK
jgi:serine/threonine-protein kinase